MNAPENKIKNCLEKKDFTSVIYSLMRLRGFTTETLAIEMHVSIERVLRTFQSGNVICSDTISRLARVLEIHDYLLKELYNTLPLNNIRNNIIFCGCHKC